ncbi:MAG TPA: [acyl-carrier-protein] S-malonyltransferase [Desulfotomaculum sp.]|nr:MAG: malonyl CoA-ACP transacylase [Peptococcaceae bacterium BRH_c8a]KJS79367.1 MAG: malonyl CoA-ACP transacylase [Desulfotomaculum sp. BICA1-6]HBX22390.1 [acyl-carrier-protein] S-malonyltransferase [Desulfotomaculum sp.]
MIAFVFPGQGSQQVGMGKSLFERYDFVREIFSEADQVLGFSVTDLIFGGPEDELRKTANAQPAILTISVAMHELLKRSGIQPDAVAGHSLGEYSALVAAGALRFRDAVHLVRLRGQYMQDAVPLGQGGMVAVLGLTGDEIEAGCRRVSEVGTVETANFNCPGQVVVAGETAALKRAMEIFKEMGARRCIPLQVSAPFHSSLMLSAARKLQPQLEQVEIKDPQIPVVANVNAGYVKTASAVRDALLRQVSGAVMWEQSVKRLIADGHKVFLEVGPGQVLTGLIKKINKEVSLVNLQGELEPEKIMARFKEVM